MLIYIFTALSKLIKASDKFVSQDFQSSDLNQQQIIIFIGLLIIILYKYI